MLGIAVVHVAITEGGPPDLIPADPNRHDGRHLTEEVEKLRLRHGRVQIADVERGAGERPAGRRCRRGRGGGGGCHGSR